LWVGNNGSSSLTRIDPAQNKVTGKVRVGAGPCGVAIGAGSVWVDGYTSASVVRVDPKRMKVVKRIKLPDRIWDATFGAGSVWATETSLGVVARINPKTNRVSRRFVMPGATGLGNLRYGGRAVWVGEQFGNRVFRIDTRIGRVSFVRVGNGPRALAVSPTAVWVSNFSDNTVSRIDPSTRKVVATIPVGKGPDNAAIAGDGTVFVPDVTAGTVSRIDPATNKVVDTIEVGAQPFPIAFAFGDIWVPIYGGRDVDRIHVG
jgi:YVTN family beta-propeller protein